MNNDPRNPFNWRLRTEPSIFAKDPYFAPRGSAGRTASQIASAALDSQRVNGKSPVVVHGLGKDEREKALIAYKQFGTYSKAHPAKKPNKHEKDS